MQKPGLAKVERSKTAPPRIGFGYGGGAMTMSFVYIISLTKIYVYILVKQWNISSQVKGFFKVEQMCNSTRFWPSTPAFAAWRLGDTTGSQRSFSSRAQRNSFWDKPRAYASWKMLENHKPEGTVGKARLPLKSPWNKLWGNDNRRMAPKSLGAFCTMSRSPTSQLMV